MDQDEETSKVYDSVIYSQSFEINWNQNMDKLVVFEEVIVCTWDDQASELHGPSGRVQRLLRELDAIAPKIKEEDKAILLLVFLASSYEHLKTTLIHRKGTIIIDA